MTKAEGEKSAAQDRQLEYWAKTDKEHKAYLEAHPDKPLTGEEKKWLVDYQRMTRDPKYW